MKDNKIDSIHFRPSRIIAEKIKDQAKKERITQAEIMRRALESYFTGESKMNIITIQSPLGNSEEVALFLGALHQLREHWRDVRSRINLPRPIRPGDDEEMAAWRTQKEQVGAYFSVCEDAKKRLEKLHDFLLGMTSTEYESLRTMGELVTETASRSRERRSSETDATRVAQLDRHIQFLELILKWMRNLGIV